MNGDAIVRLIEIKEVVYPTIVNTQYIRPRDDIIEIVKFLDNTISRANEFKDEIGHYPEDIEDLIGYEELKI